jgi:Ca-activated chloride channel family protein
LGNSGRGGGGGFRRYLVLDEPTLQGMADATGGAYYRAEDAEQLYDVFVSLPSEIVLQRERLEIGAFFALAGAAFAGAAVALALIWHRLP